MADTGADAGADAGVDGGAVGDAADGWNGFHTGNVLKGAVSEISRAPLTWRGAGARETVMCGSRDGEGGPGRGLALAGTGTGTGFAERAAVAEMAAFVGFAEPVEPVELAVFAFAGERLPEDAERFAGVVAGFAGVAATVGRRFAGEGAGSGALLGLPRFPVP